MDLVKVNEFLETMDKTGSITKAVGSSAIYTDSVFTRPEARTTARKTEFKMSVDVAPNRGLLMYNVPLFSEQDVDLIKRSNEFNYVHIGAIVIAISSLFKRTKGIAGMCVVVDNMWEDIERAVVASFEFNLDEGRAAFLTCPSFSIAKEDVCNKSRFSILFLIKDMNIRSGYHPFAINSGLIYTQTISEFPMGYKIMGSTTYQEIVGTSLLDLKEVNGESVARLKAMFNIQDTTVPKFSSSRQIGRRGLLNKKSPIYLREYRRAEKGIVGPFKSNPLDLESHGNSESKSEREESGGDEGDRIALWVSGQGGATGSSASGAEQTAEIPVRQHWTERSFRAE